MINLIIRFCETLIGDRQPECIPPTQRYDKIDITIQMHNTC